MKIIFCFLIMIILSGCYSTSNSEAVGAIKIQENDQTSTYLVFGFAMIKIVKPKNTDIEIIRNYGMGTQFISSPKRGYIYSFGAWGDKTTIMDPESNTIHLIDENIFNDNIEVYKDGK